MKTVTRSVLLWHSAATMFDLVSDVARYPEFLPWCDRAAVLETHADGVTAEVGLAFGGIQQRFVTRNRHVAGVSIDLELVEGPFSKLEGHWRFKPVGDEEACKVELVLRYDFASGALSALVGPVFDRIAASLIDAFVKRADALSERPH